MKFAFSISITQPCLLHLLGASGLFFQIALQLHARSREVLLQLLRLSLGHDILSYYAVFSLSVTAEESALPLS